ncbi:MAG TPA: AraC family transcriptional regulator [Candidatus Nitrosocosmicus sp.]|nr:AraC family transcriptional regulator [Candidatus Nitrosocosmicus sp.]
MLQKYKEFMGDGPFPFPEEKLGDFLEFCPHNDIAVCLNRTPILFPDDPTGHCHNSYEFMIPSDPMPYNEIESKCIPLKENTLFSINPWQHHGTSGKMHMASMLAVHVNKSLLSEFSKELYNTSDFYFDNHFRKPDKEIRQLLMDYIKEYRNKQAGYQFILESLSGQLVVKLLRIEKEVTDEGKISPKPANHKGVHKVIEFFREHYNSNDYSSEEIARIANLSPYHFIRLFKQETGKTPYEFLTGIKIEKAKNLLKNNEHTITEIGRLCGFTSHSHFTSTFRKKTGVSPKEYQQEIT